MRARDESGFTMIMTVIGMSLIVLLAAVAVTAVNGSAQATSHDVARKQAYEAAVAGINEYAYHLHANSIYWAKCTEATAKGEPTALNQKGSTKNRRPVPGVTGSTYALELIPATNQKECVGTNIETATKSMLEGTEPMRGTFRVRATGYAGNAQARVTATFKPASFLDYVYFTQFETSDPVTYGNPEVIAAANRQCNTTIYEGRDETPLKNLAGRWLTASGGTTTNERSAVFCDVISFVSEDNIEGPMHTNDVFAYCGSPELGGEPGDQIEVGYPETPGWFETRQLVPSWQYYSSCSGSNSKVVGHFEIGSSNLVPPETNKELSSIAESTYRFEGETTICLEGTTLRTGPGKTCTSAKRPFPTNGVIYVANKNAECNAEYTPFNVQYQTTGTNTCGNLNIVEGKYSKPLTIAAENNVLIQSNVEKTAGSEGMLGLIANNFIRVYHPVELKHPIECEYEYDRNGRRTGEKCTENLSEWECKGNLSGATKVLNIEAALLALQHSFIVDNYKCGSRLGTLTVTGAIAQKYRGAVGTTGSGGAGYLKHYIYDERLRTTEPPSFIEPIKSDWVIGRETTE
jgi:type II secretory pathway pseudopilin PulG